MYLCGERWERGKNVLEVSIPYVSVESGKEREWTKEWFFREVETETKRDTERDMEKETKQECPSVLHQG